MGGLRGGGKTMGRVNGGERKAGGSRMKKGWEGKEGENE